MTSARPGARRRRRIGIGGRRRASPISPLLANLYFRRFLLAWERFGHREQLDAHVINYADDLVICCRPGNGSAALATMRQLMTRLGLTVNEAKTRLARLPEESFDFLGYTIGRFYGKDGAPYIGTRPSRKAVRRLLQRIHDATTPHITCRKPRTTGRRHQSACSGAGPSTSTKGRSFRPTELCAGMCNGGFNDGWCDAADKQAPGIRQYPDEYLYETLGLYALPRRRADLPSAKA